jgi:hypothetical protein
MGRGGVALFAVCSAAALFVGCDVIRERLTPTEPTPAEATPAPAPLAIPVILAKPAPTPAPTPKPTPQPTATPTPDPPPSSGSCSVPPSNASNPSCSRQDAAFLGRVNKAVNLLIQQQPGIFDLKNKTCEDCYYVKDVSKYATGVIRNLNAAGMCAQYDGEELAVKQSNSNSEQFDILLASGHIRRGPGVYRLTCRPSWF